jgi:hypothetical protein
MERDHVRADVEAATIERVAAWLETKGFQGRNSIEIAAELRSGEWKEKP